MLIIKRQTSFSLVRATCYITLSSLLGPVAMKSYTIRKMHKAQLLQPSSHYLLLVFHYYLVECFLGFPPKSQPFEGHQMLASEYWTARENKIQEFGGKQMSLCQDPIASWLIISIYFTCAPCRTRISIPSLSTDIRAAASTSPSDLSKWFREI